MNASTSFVVEPASTSSTFTSTISTPPVCRYFVRGICHFGSMCRFLHTSSGGEDVNINNNEPTSSNVEQQPKPGTSKQNWINAPVFIPHRMQALSLTEGESSPVAQNINKKSWAAVVSGATATRPSEATEPGSLDMICPYEQPCPYGIYCSYVIHLELCGMCDQFCLHPTDQNQRRKHNQECLQQHEQAMELSFAIARSKDKTCGICFDTIMEKSGGEKRFGILPNCSHIFCLECIRKWRQAKQFEHKITRSCPECRVSSDFVCPSPFWVETKEEKDKLLNDYRTALGIKDCKYFQKGDGKCPFGNKCFYKHALPNGILVDVGCPKRARKIHRSANEIMNLLDIYLWEFVDHRDYHWLDMLSSSDDSDSDWSEQ